MAEFFEEGRAPTPDGGPRGYPRNPSSLVNYLEDLSGPSDTQARGLASAKSGEGGRKGKGKGKSSGPRVNRKKGGLRFALYERLSPFAKNFVNLGRGP